tara:strand:- start:5938 stop:6120 length:183 start_codon:yes stop_codon:yes gene_type:complete
LGNSDKLAILKSTSAKMLLIEVWGPIKLDNKIQKIMEEKRYFSLQDKLGNKIKITSILAF